ncbi:MAG: bifunctional hydroxymethylpyrimidine kinase/phosphomethylpyrimidine kinase [Plesiomonas sp.]|uniref:bifunctional hydroxymethylpyrimidine kinase/phosphomethylpyrimidine kinase n=1 Tax=Plesiomonas sp. TaxID=2486279 RepID=UPI003F3B9120
MHYPFETITSPRIISAPLSLSHHTTPPVPSAPMPVILTIAGSDSGGGAGIQADIKTISATGSYACSVITAITAQNTCGVQGVFPLSAQIVEQQLHSVLSDFKIQAVKIGMLHNADIIQTVAHILRQYQPPHIVLDPVMIATSGDTLLSHDAISILCQELLPLATLITPNLPEAAVLFDVPIPTYIEDISGLLPQLQPQLTTTTLLKGGHIANSPLSTDWLLMPTAIHRFDATRINTHHTHGTGCTLSAAIASFLAHGEPLERAVYLAKQYLTNALQAAHQWHLGHGKGPVDHLFALR